LLEAFDLVLASIPRMIEIVANCLSCARKSPPRKKTIGEARQMIEKLEESSKR